MGLYPAQAKASRAGRHGALRNPPGQQLQHDWAERFVTIAGLRQKVHLAVNVLGYSRALHAVAMPRADAERTDEAIIKAFEAFGGVAATVLADNQKSAVLDWPDGKPRFNSRFREMARL